MGLAFYIKVFAKKRLVGPYGSWDEQWNLLGPAHGINSQNLVGPYGLMGLTDEPRGAVRAHGINSRTS